MSKKKVLFFYNSNSKGFDLSKAKLEAKKLGAVSRDASAYNDGDFLESCDSVAGCPPKAYIEKYGALKAEKSPEQIAEEKKAKAEKAKAKKEAAAKAKAEKAGT